jgi:DNA-binding transcriptional ArsR family regulator
MVQPLHINQRMKATEIFIKFQIEQSVASHHQAVLKRAGFVRTQRGGKCIFYSLNYNRLNEFYYHAKGF